MWKSACNGNESLVYGCYLFAQCRNINIIMENKQQTLFFIVTRMISGTFREAINYFTRCMNRDELSSHFYLTSFSNIAIK